MSRLVSKSPSNLFWTFFLGGGVFFSLEHSSPHFLYALNLLLSRLFLSLTSSCSAFPLLPLRKTGRNRTTRWDQFVSTCPSSSSSSTSPPEMRSSKRYWGSRRYSLSLGGSGRSSTLSRRTIFRMANRERWWRDGTWVGLRMGQGLGRGWSKVTGICLVEKVGNAVLHDFCWAFTLFSRFSLLHCAPSSTNKSQDLDSFNLYLE